VRGEGKETERGAFAPIARRVVAAPHRGDDDSDLEAPTAVLSSGLQPSPPSADPTPPPPSPPRTKRRSRPAADADGGRSRSHWRWRSGGVLVGMGSGSFSHSKSFGPRVPLAPLRPQDVRRWIAGTHSRCVAHTPERPEADRYQRWIDRPTSPRKKCRAPVLKESASRSPIPSTACHAPASIPRDGTKVESSNQL